MVQARRPRLRLSVLVLSCGLLVTVLWLPFVRVPFDDGRLMHYLCAVTVVLGILAIRQGERGQLAQASRIVTYLAAALLGLLLAMPLALIPMAPVVLT